MPLRILPDMATTLTNLGAVDGVQNRMEEGRQHYEEALKIYSQLAQQNPATLLAGRGRNIEQLWELRYREPDGRRPPAL